MLAVQSWIAAAFFLFILVTSNPFARLAPAPFEGRDLNPVLQDLGLAIHPPLLYLGYVGFSISFSFAIAALIEGKHRRRLGALGAAVDARRLVLPHARHRAGLVLGLLRARLGRLVVLGSGRERLASCRGSSARRCCIRAVVTEKRDALKVWTMLLAILAFSLSLLGTFLVRSGVLTSVHAFATDPTRGMFILAFLVLFIGGSLALYRLARAAAEAGRPVRAGLARGHARPQQPAPDHRLRDGLFGTLYPLALEALTGDKISVGAPFFNLTFAPLILPLLVAVPFGPLLAWKRGDLLGRRRSACSAPSRSRSLRWRRASRSPARSPCWRPSYRARLLRHGGSRERTRRADATLPVTGGVALARARGLPRSAWGTALAHFGLGVSLLGIVCETQWGAERIASVKPGQTLELRGYELRFDGLDERQGPNYRELAGSFTVRRDGEAIAVMEPAKRSFPARENATTEAALMTRGFSQLYLSLASRYGEFVLLKPRLARRRHCCGSFPGSWLATRPSLLAASGESGRIRYRKPRSRRTRRRVSPSWSTPQFVRRGKAQLTPKSAGRFVTDSPRKLEPSDQGDEASERRAPRASSSANARNWFRCCRIAFNSREARMIAMAA